MNGLGFFCYCHDIIDKIPFKTKAHSYYLKLLSKIFVI
ncbi:hypothetical protein AO369_0785 [Moraxella catarrhalis]|nr:hypothetical protein AO369_0785 [Moraxella catarrhalis]